MLIGVESRLHLQKIVSNVLIVIETFKKFVNVVVKKLMLSPCIEQTALWCPAAWPDHADVLDLSDGSCN